MWTHETPQQRYQEDADSDFHFPAAGQVGKTKDLGARVMAQWIKYVLRKPESAQHPCECQAVVLAVCNPSDQEVETGRVPLEQAGKLGRATC